MRTLSFNTLTSSIALSLCLLVAMPTMAQNNRRGSVRTEQNRSNNSGSRKSDNSNGRRPNINPGKKNDNNGAKVQPDRNQVKPGNQGNGRPNKPAPNVKPNKPGNNKPSVGHNPGKPNRPAPNVRPNNPGHHTPPPHSHRPNYRPMPHVAPPPVHHHYNAPRISGILGITFGTLYNATLDYLYRHNYIVNGYINDMVYLRDVSQMGYTWEDVMLNYTAGRLSGAQFVHSTRYSNRSRYNNVYSNLCRTYGAPISTRYLPNNGRECVWYGGYNHGMVSLEYYRENGRYYTTLSFGNTY